MVVRMLDANSEKKALDHAIDAILAGNDVLIGRDNQAVAAMIPLQDYEALIEELEDLRDARDAQEVAEAIERGEMEVYPLEVVIEDLRRRGLLDE